MSDEKPLPDWMLEKIGRYAVEVERHVTGEVRTSLIRMAEWERLIEAIRRYGRECAEGAVNRPSCPIHGTVTMDGDDCNRC